MRTAAVCVFALLVITSTAAQTLHRYPSLPSDDQFRNVNLAIERSRVRHPEVDSALMWALIWTESKYDSLAQGTKGEVGLGQLRPTLANALGVRDRTNVNESIGAVVDYMARLNKKYKQNVRLMLAAYNGGETVVDKCWCVPQSTRGFVDQIEDRLFFARRVIVYLGTADSTEKENVRAQLFAQNPLQAQAAALMVSYSHGPDYTERHIGSGKLPVKFYAKEDSPALLPTQNSAEAQAKALIASYSQAADYVERHIGSGKPPDAFYAKQDLPSQLPTQVTPVAQAKATVPSHTQATNYVDLPTGPGEQQDKVYSLVRAKARKPQPAKAEMQIASVTETGPEIRRRQCEELRDKPQASWPCYCFTGNF
jgi:hypothetical protein